MNGALTSVNDEREFVSCVDGTEYTPLLPGVELPVIITDGDPLIVIAELVVKLVPAPTAVAEVADIATEFA